MDCEFMEFIAENLALNGVNVARFEFPFQTRQRLEKKPEKYHRPGKFTLLLDYF